MDIDAPVIPAALLDGWRQTAESVEQPFDARIVSVHAHTVVYEDAALREELRTAAGVDYQWRFFVAARLVLRPRAPPSKALTRLVASRAHAGFEERLEERGFSGIRRTDERSRAVAGTNARVASFEALCRLADVSVRTTGRAAVRPTDDAYLLVAGAFPTAVRDSADEDLARTVEDHLDPERFDAELDDLIAAVE
jgi:hypothetical protein